MSITEADRRLLYQALQKLMGKEADIMMNALPTDPDDLATRADLQLLGADLRTEMADLRTDMADLRSELRTDMSELRAEMAELGATLRAEFHAATTGQTRTLLFGLIGTVVTMSTVQLVSVLTLS